MEPSEIRAAHLEDLRIVQIVLSRSVTHWKMPERVYALPELLGPELSVPLPEVGVPVVAAELQSVSTVDEELAMWASDMALVGDYLTRRTDEMGYCGSGVESMVRRVNSMTSGPDIVLGDSVKEARYQGQGRRSANVPL